MRNDTNGTTRPAITASTGDANTSQNVSVVTNTTIPAIIVAATMTAIDAPINFVGVVTRPPGPPRDHPPVFDANARCSLATALQVAVYSLSVAAEFGETRI